MKKDELLLIIKEGEGLTVEFKEKYTTKIVQDMVAMANSKGGKILLGVTDDGKIKGEKLTGQLKAEIFSLGRNCDPEIEVTIKQIEDVTVIVVEEGDDKPYSCSGNYYKRFDAVTQKLNRNETRAIFDSSTTIHYDEKPNAKSKLSDISLKKVRSFYKLANIKYRVNQETLPNILKSLNLMENNLINNTGVLFFAEKLDQFFLHSQIMLLAFKDYVGAKIFDRKEVRGDLLLQFSEAEFFLKRHLSLQAIIESTRRRDVYEVPEDAWREAIANAIIHRDYRMGGTSIQVRIFPDRIEVISPGSLPKGITTKNIGEMSSRRNELIADMFARLNVVEKAGTGIIRIREAMKNQGLKAPVFEDMGTFFKIILYRPKGVGEVNRTNVLENSRGNVQENGRKSVRVNVLENVLEDVLEKYALKSTQTIAKVLNTIIEKPDITSMAIAEKLSITDRTVRRSINYLKKNGIIKRVGPDKGGYWKLIKIKSANSQNEQ